LFKRKLVIIFYAATESEASGSPKMRGLRQAVVSRPSGTGKMRPRIPRPVSLEIGDIDIPDRPISAFSSYDLGGRPDKVRQIISSWKLRFNGDQDGLSVDKFLYRVEAVTRQTLNSRYDLLCGNASVLFERKAREYYWRTAQGGIC